MSGDALALNCPTCGQTLEYLGPCAAKSLHVPGGIGVTVYWGRAEMYRCQRHGRFKLTNRRGLKPEPM